MVLPVIGLGAIKGIGAIGKIGKGAAAAIGKAIPPIKPPKDPRAAHIPPFPVIPGVPPYVLPIGVGVGVGAVGMGLIGDFFRPDPPVVIAPPVVTPPAPIEIIKKEIHYPKAHYAPIKILKHFKKHMPVYAPAIAYIIDSPHARAILRGAHIAPIAKMLGEYHIAPVRKEYEPIEIAPAPAFVHPAQAVLPTPAPADMMAFLPTLLILGAVGIGAYLLLTDNKKK